MKIPGAAGLIGSRLRGDCFVGGGVNNRDRLYAQREWIAYATWRREGCTCPNALGYGSSTPIGSLLSGDIGGGNVAKSKVPTHIQTDHNVDISHRVYNQLPIDIREIICGIYMARWSEQFCADTVGITRHQVRNRLTVAYQALYEALSTGEKQGAL